VPGHQLGERRVEGGGDALRRRSRSADHLRRRTQHPAVGPRSRNGRLDHHRSLGQVAGDVLPGEELLLQAAPPRGPGIDAPLDDELVEAEFVKQELRAPAIVAKRRHAGLGPCVGADLAVLHHDGEVVVALREDVGHDGEQVTDDALRCEASFVDRRDH
jgi:hypothetical protein